MKKRNATRPDRIRMSKTGRPYIMVKMWVDRDARIHGSMPTMDLPVSPKIKFHGSFARGENWLASLVEELCLLAPTMIAKNGNGEPD